MRYDILRDFAPVSMTGSLPYVLAVTTNSPAKSIGDLVDMARARPGKINYAGMVGAVPQAANHGVAARASQSRRFIP